MKRNAMAMVVVFAVTMGCSSTGDDEPDGVVEADAALRIMVDVEDGIDVAEAELTVTSCEGDVEVEAMRAPIDDWAHEAVTPAYVDGGHHLFWEHYIEVAAGCYDVTVDLYSANGQQSSNCTAALGMGIEVESGQTREVVLFSRCGGIDGGIDDGPTVEMLEYIPTAFLSCGESVQVCATIRNVGDVRASWGYYAGQPLPTLPRDDGKKRKKDDRRSVHCSTWEPDYHGETVGLLTATPAYAEVIDDGHGVLFADKHQVRFSMYMECPDKKKAGPLPTFYFPKDRKVSDFKKIPEVPKFPKIPKDDKKFKDEEGGLKAIAALNHPPKLTSVEYEPSKFLRCPAELVLCATAIDPDGDPLLFKWRKLEGPQLVSGPTVVESVESSGEVRQCVHLEFADQGASYNFKIIVYDLVHHPERGLVPIEQWLFEQTGEIHSSHASLQVPVHVGCD